MPLFSCEGRTISKTIPIMNLKWKDQRNNLDKPLSVLNSSERLSKAGTWLWMFKYGGSRRELNFSDTLLNEKQHHRTAQLNQSKAIFRPKNREIMCLRSMYLHFKICRRAKRWSIEPGSGQKPAWFSRIRILQIPDNRWEIMLESSLDAILIKSTVLWFSHKNVPTL